MDKVRHAELDYAVRSVIEHDFQGEVIQSKALWLAVAASIACVPHSEKQVRFFLRSIRLITTPREMEAIKDFVPPGLLSVTIPFLNRGIEVLTSYNDLAHLRNLACRYIFPDHEVWDRIESKMLAEQATAA